MDMVFRQDASPSWWGIEHGLELLKQGLLWRVGNGEKINIWRDRWLPRDFNMTPIAGKTNTRIRRVNQLVSRNPNE
jgi:hypothetical protein